MRILFDQGTPVGIRRHLRGHDVTTAREKGWGTLTNGELLREAEDAGFQILLTADTHLQEQQNLRNRKIAIVVLSRNRWKSIRRKIGEIVAAIEATSPDSYHKVTI